MKILITVLCGLALTSPCAYAQSTPRTSSSAGAAAPVQPLQPPRGDLSGYRLFDANAPLADWRVANDTVAKIGGWRAYAREATADAALRNAVPADLPASALPPSPSPTPRLPRTGAPAAHDHSRKVGK